MLQVSIWLAGNTEKQYVVHDIPARPSVRSFALVDRMFSETSQRSLK